MLKNSSSDHKPTLLVRLDADHHVGLAHAVRVSTLLSLCETAMDIQIVGNTPQADKFFDPGITTFHSSNTLKTADDIAADMILIDHPRIAADEWQTLNDSPYSVIAIDDEGGPVQADMIINGTILDAYHHYPLTAPETEIHCGAEYALINPCFAQNPWQNPADQSLITIIGSGNRARDWALALTAPNGPLAQYAGPKTMIVGAAFPEIAELKNRCTDLNIQLHQGVKQPEMATMLASHQMGLITGGMIVYESLAVGLPVIVFPQEKNLPPEAQFFSREKAIIDLGYEEGMDMTYVHKTLNELAKSQKKRLELSNNAKNLIDGYGMERAAKLIDQFITDRVTTS